MVASKPPLRIGFVPEHFSTPLHFAQAHFSLSAHLLPYPSGTGAMITAIRAGEIDVGIGLTESWVARLGQAGANGKDDAGYRIVGTYVKTPLCWAISTGSERADIRGVPDLKGGKIGVSRIGSGSYVMGFVLADEQGWLEPAFSGADRKAPFEVVPLQTFEKLRQGVNDGTADFFMWEHFTSKKYWDNGEIIRVGEIYTPWSSWLVVASTALIADSGSGTGSDERLEEMFEKVDMGTKYFLEHQDEAVKFISTELDYSAGDAREWLKTVEFARNMKGVDLNVVQKTIDILKKAGVLGEEAMKAEDMIARILSEPK